MSPHGPGNVHHGWYLFCFVELLSNLHARCELMVAMYHGEAPKIPYIPQRASTPIPEQIIKKAIERSTAGLSIIPHSSEKFRHIFYLMHLLAIAYAQPHTQLDLDSYIIEPLYDAEYAMLLVLDAKTQPELGMSKIEIMLIEAFQLHFWTVLRRFPAHAKFGELLILRSINALIPVCMDFEPAGDVDGLQMENLTLEMNADEVLQDISTTATRKVHYPKGTLYAITWCLALGTILTAPFGMPENKWYSENFAIYFYELAFDTDEKGYHEFLDLFPETRAFPWVDLGRLYTTIKVEENSPG